MIGQEIGQHQQAIQQPEAGEKDRTHTDTSRLPRRRETTKKPLHWMQGPRGIQ